VNTIKVWGNNVADISTEVASNEKTTKFAKGRIACNRSRAENAPVDFYSFVGFGDLAESMNGLKKGAFIKVTGTLQSNTYGEGESRRTSYEIVAKSVEIVERKSKEPAE